MQCACHIAESDDKNPLRLNPCPEHERWAKAIRAIERESCAKIADGIAASHADGDGEVWIAGRIAAAIRAGSTYGVGENL